MPAAVKDSGTGRQTLCAKASASLGRVRRGRERPTLGERLAARGLSRDEMSGGTQRYTVGFRLWHCVTICGIL